MNFPLSLEVYSHTEAYVSNNWNTWLAWYSLDEYDGYEMEWYSLTNEYTDGMLQYHTEADLALITDWSGLDWGERWARTNHNDQAYVETIPSNEMFAACLITTNHADLRLQDLQYRWTLSTTAGVAYKFLWLEAFRPQGGDTYSDYELKSDVLMGTGGDVQTKTFAAARPWDRWDTPYGTIEPIGFLVELECSLAETNKMGFGIEPPEPICFAVWDEETAAAESDQSKINSALTVFFSKASTPEGDPTNFNVTMHVYPEDLPGVTWAKTDGPNSGTLLNSDQTVATFSNATKGGLYTFSTTISGADPITSRLWLPVSGPDISVDFQREIDYLADWIVDYEAYQPERAVDELPPEDQSNTNMIEGKKYELWLGDLEDIGLKFDYETPPEHRQDICGLAHVYTTNDSAGDSSRFVIEGTSRPYVTDFAKRNNMGFAMFAYHMGIPSYFIPYGPNIYRFFKGGIVGAKDDQYARKSYDAGISLAQGNPLASVIQAHALDMQPPAMRVSKEWPGEGIAETNAIHLHQVTSNLLEKAAGR